MRLLLDTHVLLWWLDDSRALSARPRELIADPSDVVVVSAGSIGEIRIKEGLGKVKLPPQFREIVERQPFEKLPVTLEHVHHLRNLPPHHRDPFDRMLIAQAQCEAMTLVTTDEAIRRYAVDCVVA